MFNFFKNWAMKNRNKTSSFDEQYLRFIYGLAERKEKSISVRKWDIKSNIDVIIEFDDVVVTLTFFESSKSWDIKIRSIDADCFLFYTTFTSDIPKGAVNFILSRYDVTNLIIKAVPAKYMDKTIKETIVNNLIEKYSV